MTSTHWASFVRTVWALQRRLPDSQAVGFQGPPAREALRFRPVLNLDSPVKELVSVRRVDGAESSQYEVETNLLSLYGTPSPLPASYTEDLLDDADDGLLRGFLDIFNHRLISLLYRAMVKYRHNLQFDWDGEDAISTRLRLLSGIRGVEPHHDSPTDARTDSSTERPTAAQIRGAEWLAYTASLRRRTTSASSLLGMLRTRFEGIAIDLTQCVPQWLPIPGDQQIRLGVAQSTLGEDACIGERVLDRSSTIRVTVGPLLEEAFVTFLPGGSRMQELREILDLSVGTEFDQEVELVLAAEEQPELRLASRQARLGYSTWFESANPSQPSRVRFHHPRWHHG